MTFSVDRQQPQRNSRLLLLLLLIVLGAGGALVWYLSQPPNPVARIPVLTPEAKAYTKYLKLSGVEMKATDNALGQTLVEITGKITNTGDKALKSVSLTCVFYDPYNKVLVREVVPIVRSRDGVLYPDETRKFRLPFDSLPKEWNQRMPQLVIAEIIFE